MCGLCPLAAQAWTEPTGARFNHASTGYPLTGAHAVQRCEACHLGGTMKGTTRTCESCHTAGSTLAKAHVVMPRKHVPAVVGCAECHNTQSFTRTRFRHSVVTGVGCQTCHCGAYLAQGAMAATAQHIPYKTMRLNGASMDCAGCHAPMGRAGARFAKWR